MLLPSSCLRFGPTPNHTVTVGTHHKDQADRAMELKRWIKQQGETLHALYGKEVEICFSPLLLEEIEECFCETDWAAMTFEPGRNRPSPAHDSSKRRRSRRKHSTPAAAAALAELVKPTAASPQLTLAEPPAEPSSPPPGAAEFPAGFSSCPGRRRRQRAAAVGKVWVGASYASMEGPPVTASSWLFSPARVQSGPEIPQEELMRLQVRNFAEYLRVFPEELNFVHLILEAEFLERRWLDTPLPLFARGLFAPLLKAAAGCSGSSEPQLATARSSGPSGLQPVAARYCGSSGPQPAVAGSSGSCEPHHVPEEPEGGLPPLPGPEHLLAFLWGVLMELKPDTHHDTPQPV
ncbi:hypothetical protein AMECASPLE_010788 [Ameca splendens]|uniref:Uncharacterized protein n=1 Tax=Ameca splendens TaxID=208324 RepID=A0ABV0Z9F1_9TELE